MLARLGSNLAVLALVLSLPWLRGQDPAYLVLRAGSAEREATPEQLAGLRERLGLDRGAVAYARDWVIGAAHGDLGTSWVSGRPVGPAVAAALLASLAVMTAALLVGLVTAAALAAPAVRDVAGGPAAGYPQAPRSGAAGYPQPPRSGATGHPRPRRSGSVASALTSTPEYVLATGLLLVLSVGAGWLPPFGWSGPAHVVLPALALGLPTGGFLARLVLDALDRSAAEPWMATWRALGFGPRRIALGVLRRTLPALLPQVGLVVAGLTGGAVVVEQVFAVPGLGRLALDAALGGDLPPLQAAVCVLLLLGLLAGSASELLRRVLLGPAAREAGLATPGRVLPAPAGRRWVPVAIASLLIVVVAGGLPRDAYGVELSARLAAPSALHPLGTDALGRDLLARLGTGAARTLLVAAAVSLACWLVGVLIGLRPALARGLSETLNALPPVIAGIVTATVLGPSEAGAAVAVLAVSWMGPARHAAALVQEASGAAYLQASRSLGAAPWRILRREILPVVAGPVFRHVVVRLPGVALALATLGFLGLGAAQPDPSWGRILAEGLPYAERAPWVVLAPAGLLALTGVLATHPGLARLLELRVRDTPTGPVVPTGASRNAPRGADRAVLPARQVQQLRQAASRVGPASQGLGFRRAD